MDPDDVAYRKSVRNTVVVLAVVVVVLAASIGLTLLFDVTPNTFQTKTSVGSTYPLTLTLEINSTSAKTTGAVEITAWLNGSSTSSGNVSATTNWAFDQSGLVTSQCPVGWPLGIGVMQGHYTTDNYSLGTLLLLHEYKLLLPCPLPDFPQWFLFPSQASRVLVSLGGTPEFWVLQNTVDFNPGSLHSASLTPGVYTAVAADEWGDFVLTNFRIS